MAVHGERIEFNSFVDMARHLDRWAKAHLDSPQAWEQALLSSTNWLDYSGRNQILLASYRADGPVAGVETWRLVPSTEDGRGCAVRAGEHGYPVRVPITSQGSEPDPYLGGVRPTRSRVEQWEWRPVFSVAQLARKPAPDSLVPVPLPSTLHGAAGEQEYLTAVRDVATKTIRGRLPKSEDPDLLLSDAAGRVSRSSKRPDLTPDLRRQVAWLVADRVGRAPTPEPPSFDPSSLKPRERWERLQDVLDPARKLTAALGVTVGVDLVASPLPRMEIIDDRVVTAGRRHRLPAASLEQLPVGVWTTVGPYTPAEWAARGERASGLGAYCRLNKTAYLVATEAGDGTATWRLEDVASRTGNGLLAKGAAPDLATAKADALTTLRDRYPALRLAGPPDRVPEPPEGIRHGTWETMPGSGRQPGQVCYLDGRVILTVLPGPGGRWQPLIQLDPTATPERLPLQPTADAARDAAELAGLRAQRMARFADPATADVALAAFADSGAYTRAELGTSVASFIDTAQQQQLPDAGPAELADILGMKFSPATIVAVLHADGVDADTMAQLLPELGVPMADGIQVLHDRWQLDRVHAAERLGATATEMREAGCTATEIMASRPREVLRTLPDDPELWATAAATMSLAGHPEPTVVRHLVAHAPTPEAFAVALDEICEGPETLAVAARANASPEQLAAASEALGLSPEETFDVLVGAAPTTTVLDVAALRCDGDLDAVARLADVAGIPVRDLDSWRNPTTVVARHPAGASVGLADAAALLAALPAPEPAAAVPSPADALDLVQPTLLEPTT